MLLYSYWESVCPHGSTEISCAASWARSILSKLPWRWPKVSSYPHVSVLLHTCLCFPRCQLSSTEFRPREFQDWMNTWLLGWAFIFPSFRSFSFYPREVLAGMFYRCLETPPQSWNGTIQNQIHENQITQYDFLTWSIAHGIRHWIFSLPLKICGNDELKDGAAWIAGKLILPKKHVWKN